MKTIAGIEAEREQGKGLLFGKSVRVEQKLEDAEKAPTLRTVIPFVMKSLNEDARTMEFIGSTATEDRYGDSITQAGWVLENFLKCPVVPWGHNYNEPPVAKALEVGLRDGNLAFKAQFATAEEYAFADTIFKLYKGGYLRAFSVGFRPIEYEGNWEDGYVFTKCELLEVSCVTVPANPEALVLAFGDGTLSENDRKQMVASAGRLIKSLTEKTDDSQNEDMETANAIKETNTLLAEVRDALVELKKDAPVPAEPEDKKDDVKPEDKPSGGAELDLSSPEVQNAIKNGVTDALNKVTGKIE
jgi:HK97 family phage prohead protease